ncbi:MAG TPA: hypothetical protein VMS56_07435 [Thermoanaerobaculia bacterium]|nr:hypothetical protein [Thermoanaerobaculia bacterium]
MEFRLPIRSRVGNLALLLVGLTFLVAGSAILAFAVFSTWGFAGTIDRVLQIVLLGCAAFGAYLIAGARRNIAPGSGSFSRKRA